MSAAGQEVAHYRRIGELKLREAWEGYITAYESVKMLREAIESAKLYVVSIEKSHAKGLKSLFDYYEAKAKLFEVERDLATSLFDIAVSYADLLEACGELTHERLAELDRMLYAH